MPTLVPSELPPRPFYHNNPHITPNNQSVASANDTSLIAQNQYLQIRSLSLDVIKADLAILRPGHEFQLECPTTDEEVKLALKRGCFNLHFPITFQDGVKWLLRVRRNYNRPDHPLCPPAHYWPGVEREVTTLQVLVGKGIGTVPNAYIPASRVSVTPGYDTAHFYCDFMPDLGEASRFIESYADQQIAISDLSFKGIGQLIRDNSGNVSVGAMCQHAIQLPGPPWMIGPCPTLQEALFGYWTEQIHHANLPGPLGLRYYLSFLDKKRILSSYGDLSGGSEQTYIKHADEGIYQFFTDGGRLSAVLDWEWAYTTIKEQAFMAPKAFLPGNGEDSQTSDELDTLTTAEELLIEAYEQKQRPDLAACVRSGPKYRLLDLDQEFGFRTIQAVTRFRRTFGRGLDTLTFPQSIDDWVAECLEIFSGDPGLERFPAEDRLPQPKRPVPPALIFRPALLLTGEHQGNSGAATTVGCGVGDE